MLRRSAALAAALAATASATPAPPKPTFTLTLIDTAAFPLARCLDGSAPGFYFSPGSGSGATSWLVHTQGGGARTGEQPHPPLAAAHLTLALTPRAHIARPAVVCLRRRLRRPREVAARQQQRMVAGHRNVSGRHERARLLR